MKLRPAARLSLSALVVAAAIGAGAESAPAQEKTAAATRQYNSAVGLQNRAAQNPDLFVKAWYDVSGAVFLDFFHVSVPDIDVFSELPVSGPYDNQGTSTLANRLIEHRYRP